MLPTQTGFNSSGFSNYYLNNSNFQNFNYSGNLTSYNSPFAPGGNRTGLHNIGSSSLPFGAANYNTALIGATIATAVAGIVNLITAICRNKGDNFNHGHSSNNKFDNYNRENIDFSLYNDDNFEIDSMTDI